MNEPKKSIRGTAAMDLATRKRVASRGGQTVSKDKKHMSEIGRLGGYASFKKFGREHYVAIGRKGGKSVRAKV